MSFSKYYFEQFKDDTEEEVKSFEAKAETKKISFKRCNHSRAKVMNGTLRCSCGAAWSGPNIALLQDLLTKSRITANG